MLEVPSTISTAFNDDKFMSPFSDILSPSSESSDFNVMWNQAGDDDGNGNMVALWVVFFFLIIILFVGGGYGGWRYYQQRKNRGVSKTNKQRKERKQRS